MQKPDERDESQEKPQQRSSPEPSPSPCSSIADLLELWSSGCIETLGSAEFEAGLEAFNSFSEPGVSTANSGCGEDDLSELLNWNHTEGMERADHITVTEHGDFSLGPTDSQTDQGLSATDASHPPTQSPTRSARYQKPTERPKNPVEKIGAPFAPESPTDLERPKSRLSVAIPRVVVSHTAVDNFDNAGDGKKSAVSELHANTMSTTTEFGFSKTVRQNLQSSVTGSQRPDVDRYRPNNYEIAMQERQTPPPHIVIGEIDPQMGTLAANSLNAFYADADSTISNKGVVSKTDESFGVERCCLPRNLSTFQIPNKTPTWSQRWQSSSGNALSHPTFEDSLRAPMYPSPPSSFRGIAGYHTHDIANGRDEPSATPTTSSCVSPIEPPSPISPSPSSLFDAADGVTHCSNCPDKIFTGTPVHQKNSLQRHMRDFHLGMKRLECLVRGCTVTFAPGRKDNRIKHVRAVHPDYPLPPPSKKRRRNADGDFDAC